MVILNITNYGWDPTTGWKEYNPTGLRMPRLKLDSDDSPVALWHLDGNGNDSSGNGYTLSISSSWEYCPTSDRTLVFSSEPGAGTVAYQFGTRLISSSPLLNISGDVTMMAIIRPKDIGDYTTSTYRTIAYCGNDWGPSTCCQYSFFMSSENGLFSVLKTTTGHDVIIPETTPMICRWSVITFRRSSGSVQLFINGIPQGTPFTASTLSATTPTYFYFCANYQTGLGDSWYNGNVAGVAIYPSALSDTRILEKSQYALTVV